VKEDVDHVVLARSMSMPSLSLSLSLISLSIYLGLLPALQHGAAVWAGGQTTPDYTKQTERPCAWCSRDAPTEARQRHEPWVGIERLLRITVVH